MTRATPRRCSSNAKPLALSPLWHADTTPTARPSRRPERCRSAAPRSRRPLGRPHRQARSCRGPRARTDAARDRRRAPAPPGRRSGRRPRGAAWGAIIVDGWPDAVDDQAHLCLNIQRRTSRLALIRCANRDQDLQPPGRRRHARPSRPPRNATPAPPSCRVTSRDLLNFGTARRALDGASFTRT